MGVIDTKAWLKDFGYQPIRICEELSTYFNGNKAGDIYEYLSLFGMYRSSIFTRRDDVELFLEQNYWKIVKKEFEVLKKKWNGPDIPIFILPVNQRQTEIMKENKGKSGVAFDDKLFLFFAIKVDESEIKALLTHEYNHVCRLNYISKKEEDITLLDTIILEGLAEHAVREHCGNEFVAYWTKLYSTEQLEKWWSELVYPNKFKHKNDKESQEILYGLKSNPKMLGYCVGFYLIDLLLEEKKYSLKKIEKMKTEKIIKLLKV
ncbi:DUF2268 domain-containing protein [Bacillus sp. DJP31]|uniref:DUF2268 domain-containing protein n=1 Tax=Bacillus sp. DJP31 TaxID=3409789 RepID=UPI003BB61EB8